MSARRSAASAPRATRWEPPWSRRRARARRTTCTAGWNWWNPRMPEAEPVSFDGWVCPLPLRDSPTIVMGHGGGGAMSAELVEHLFLPAFGEAADAELGDSAVMSVTGGRLAFSTDSYVVRPLFFPGGSIGDLAVNGT